jgi:hypothetical protein
MLIGEYKIASDVEGKGCGLIRGTIQALIFRG